MTAKKMAGQNVIAITALAMAGVAFLIVITSMSTVDWTHRTLSKTSITFGLWRSCESGRGASKFIITCVRNSEGASWFMATQAAVCLDFIANLGGVVALALLMFVKSLPEKVMKLLALVLMGVAVFWSFIAIVVFGAEQPYELGWSWGIMLLAINLQTVSLVLTIFVKRPEDPSS